MQGWSVRACQVSTLFPSWRWLLKLGVEAQGYTQCENNWTREVLGMGSANGSWEKEAGILNTGSGHFAVKRMKLNVQEAMGTQQRRGFPHPTRGR